MLRFFTRNLIIPVLSLPPDTFGMDYDIFEVGMGRFSPLVSKCYYESDIFSDYFQLLHLCLQQNFDEKFPVVGTRDLKNVREMP